MFASRIHCRVLETRWVTPSVFLVRFSPSKRFRFLPGQFVSVVVPTSGGFVKRCYSLASGPEEALRTGRYELCVKLVPGGAGSSFLAGLKPGDEFGAFAPYGGFTYRPVEQGRGVAFIATATGIGPFRSIVLSDAFQGSSPTRAELIFGARDEKEILYRREFRQAGVETTYALSRSAAPNEFQGRVTDYLRQLPDHWRWHTTDFYLCGNGEMIHEVNELLRGRGVAPQAIRLENFTAAPTAKPVAEPERKSSLVPALDLFKTAA